MKMGFDIAGRKSRRSYLIFDQETLAIIRCLEPEMSNAGLTSATLFLAWLEFSTDRRLFHQQQEEGLDDQKLAEIREGRQRVWVEGSRRELLFALGETTSYNTLKASISKLAKWDIVGVDNPDKTSHDNLPNLYCWHPESWSALLLLHRNSELVDYLSANCAGLVNGEQPPWSNLNRGLVNGEQQPWSTMTSGPINDDQLPSSAMNSGPVNAEQPVYREERKEKKNKRKENALSLFSNSQPGEEDLLASYDLAELQELLAWARKDPFWAEKVSSPAQLARHLAAGNILEQFRNGRPVALLAVARKRASGQ